MSIATLLPVTPRVRVAVQREAKRGNGVNHARVDPRLRPLVSREAHPSGGATKFSLHVRLGGVSLRPPGFPGRATPGQQP
eukprot:7981455-Alexandrium_andersonii.AAC.1